MCMCIFSLWLIALQLVLAKNFHMALHLFWTWNLHIHGKNVFRNFTSTPHPIFSQYSRFSCYGWKMCMRIWIYDLLIFDRVTTSLDYFLRVENYRICYVEWRLVSGVLYLASGFRSTEKYNKVNQWIQFSIGTLYFYSFLKFWKRKKFCHFIADPLSVIGYIFNQVFQRKTLVNKKMNVGGRAVGWPGGRASTFPFRSISLQPLKIFWWYLIGL